MHRHSVALGYCIREATFKSYNSALNLYLNFTKIHHMDTKPTANMLSLCIAYMSHYIDLKVISSYLSGLCNQLEIYFLSIQTECNSALVKKTLASSKKCFSSPTKQKYALTCNNMLHVIDFYKHSTQHND